MRFKVLFWASLICFFWSLVVEMIVWKCAGSTPLFQKLIGIIVLLFLFVATLTFWRKFHASGTSNN